MEAIRNDRMDEVKKLIEIDNYKDMVSSKGCLQ